MQAATPLPPSSLQNLPLFPLKSVLFPGDLLPLQVFEVRYLGMIGRRHKAGEPFGVVCLSEGDEVRQRATGPDAEGFAAEAFYPVGTLARIDELERPQAGLMLVRCTGTQRFRVLQSAQQTGGLWVADVELIADDAPMPVPDDIAFTRVALQGLLRQIERGIVQNAAGNPTNGTQQAGEGAIELPLRPPYCWDDCGWLANRWCELLPLAPALKQRFMALDSPVLRLEMVADALGQMGFALND